MPNTEIGTNIRDFKIKLNTGQHKHAYVSLNNDGDEDNDNNTKSFVLDINNSDIHCEETVDNLASIIYYLRFITFFVSVSS